MSYEITERCISCGVCADNCPADAIDQIETKYVIIQEKCKECGTCMDVCYINAIIEKTESEPEQGHG